jgi:hypothetical protein
VGLDGEVARRANRLPRWLRGHVPHRLRRAAPGHQGSGILLRCPRAGRN